MRVYKENTTVVTASELRTKFEVIAKAVHKGRVIVEKRHEPCLALLSIEEYQHIVELLDLFEDKVLAYLAEERESSMPKDKYLTHKDLAGHLDL